MNLSQRIQVFTGKKTTSDQAQMVFPSFIWLLRDVVLRIPDDYKDLTEYFLKHVILSYEILLEIFTMYLFIRDVQQLSFLIQGLSNNNWQLQR